MHKTKKSFTELILDCLQGGAETSIDLLNDFLTSYPESYRRARRGMLGEPPARFKKQWSEMYLKKKRFYRLLSNLRRDGLVEKINSGKVTSWQITEKGKQKIYAQKFRIMKSQLVSGTKKSTAVTIISYDIPEDYRYERSWLRDVLKLLGFVMIHKSVWVGNNFIPETLLKEFSRREIIEYIQIFEVTKSGTLGKIH